MVILIFPQVDHTNMDRERFIFPQAANGFLRFILKQIQQLLIIIVVGWQHFYLVLLALQHQVDITE